MFLKSFDVCVHSGCFCARMDSAIPAHSLYNTRFIIKSQLLTPCLNPRTHRKILKP